MEENQARKNAQRSVKGKDLAAEPSASTASRAPSRIAATTMLLQMQRFDAHIHQAVQHDSSVLQEFQ